MSRTYEYYREKQESLEDYERRQRLEEEREYFFDKMKMEDDIREQFENEVPSTEEELFRQILEDERNEN